ncbi:hypothetical protein FDA94_17805 [Herbidospora galbida]|uniref:Uncharacterized protein n=1 Tax=Herbidospora galbida TaxID=2575442 RepID=A0A4U3MF72_9ACTN|nr:hypothetical protein [Herbidospora galbida]TKK87360.1 hypothetical protein FDA94_17805 [Herbidospora galbida]
MAALFLLVAGCGEEIPPQTGIPVAQASDGPAPPAAEPPPVAEFRTLTGSDPVPMPFDPYVIPMDGMAELALAVEQAAYDCMHERGRTGWEKGMIRNWSPHDFNESPFYPYLDPARAAEKGYPRTSLDPELVEKASVRPSRAATADELAAYNGPDGCHESARKRIYDPPQLDVDVRALITDAKLSAARDTRFIQAVESWRICMGRRGFAYQDPRLPAMNPAWESRTEDQPAGKEERRTARADAECQAASNVAGVYATLRAAYERRSLDANRDRLGPSREVTRRWLANAHAILS